MPTNHSPLVQQLWNNWQHGHNEQAANELMDHYMYLVNFHVERIATHLPENVSKEDLKSYGMLGLYDALTKFEISRNLKFDTYASFRIRGAIIDALRKEDWLPRSLREKTKRIEQASRELEQKFHRTPTSKEIAHKLEMEVDEVESVTKDALFANILSIEEKPAYNKDDHNEGVGYTIPDSTSTLPDEHMVDVEIKKELTNSIKSLNTNEQMVISLFYHEELTLTEIGVVLDLTTSRISQIHKKAIFKLRSTLRKMEMLQ
ncbi:FliA/WhiG family RNA polymerase sigma factor [Virgibacillus sp. W0181]|uniref:FliA/WhiG family RNA polymerase sigma factor n=1 Tax=Virgibacillus sp. W0181 TaxID=3391581 RepID=UPI003F47CC0B